MSDFWAGSERQKICVGLLSKSMVMSTIQECWVSVISVCQSPRSATRAVWIVAGPEQSLQYIRLQHETTNFCHSAETVLTLDFSLGGRRWRKDDHGRMRLHNGLRSCQRSYICMYTSQWRRKQFFDVPPLFSCAPTWGAQRLFVTDWETIEVSPSVGSAVCTSTGEVGRGNKSNGAQCCALQTSRLLQIDHPVWKQS